MIANQRKAEVPTRSQGNTPGFDSPLSEGAPQRTTPARIHLVLPRSGTYVPHDSQATLRANEPPDDPSTSLNRHDRPSADAGADPRGRLRRGAAGYREPVVELQGGGPWRATPGGVRPRAAGAPSGAYNSCYTPFRGSAAPSRLAGSASSSVNESHSRVRHAHSVPWELVMRVDPDLGVQGVGLGFRFWKHRARAGVVGRAPRGSRPSAHGRHDTNEGENV